MTDLVKKLKLFGDQLDSAQQKVQFYFLVNGLWMAVRQDSKIFIWVNIWFNLTHGSDIFPDRRFTDVRLTQILDTSLSHLSF